MAEQKDSKRRVRVHNNKAHDVVLPPVKAKHAGRDWPAVRVKPGGYNLDVEYLDAIRGPKATAGARLAYKQLTTGDDPALTINEDPKALTKKEGPEAPKTLRGYSEAMALLIVQDSTDQDALALWTENETRDAVKTALRDRVARLRGSKEAA